MTDALDRLSALLATGIKVAKVAHIANLDPQTITRVAERRHPPAPRTLGKIEYALGVLVGHLCQHLDCPEKADLIFTWPQPIHRQERACHWHGRDLMGSFIRGLTVEHLGENT